MIIQLKVETIGVDIGDIVDSIAANRIRVTEHADEEAAFERISLEEICFSAMHGEIIEDYPADSPFPSCLIYGSTADGRPPFGVGLQ